MKHEREDKGVHQIVMPNGKQIYRAFNGINFIGNYLTKEEAIQAVADAKAAATKGGGPHDDFSTIGGKRKESKKHKSKKHKSKKHKSKKCY